MDGFEDVLKAKLARNAELALEQEQAEREAERMRAERAAEAERREREVEQARRARHAELVERLQRLAEQVDITSPEHLVVRSGWSASGEEFMAKVHTIQMRPSRSLLVQLDRDDDQVLVRWSSDIGESVEMWRLLEFSPDMLDELFLQAVDQELWRGRDRPPLFPGAASE
ncbi:MAG: hypothetical protein M3133_05830 [Actinomycetota bacterium]|nr:hypothetical protein [Actinomycetota bacterium]